MGKIALLIAFLSVNGVAQIVLWVLGGILLLTAAISFCPLYVPFFISWWAYSFPVAAITIATISMFRQTDMVFFKGLAYFLFLVLVLIILGLSVKTIKAISKKEIFVKED